MKFKKILLIFILILPCRHLMAVEVHETRGDFVIFSSYTGNSLYDEILRNCESALLETCSIAGRMIPYEYNYRKAAIEKNDGADLESLYRNAALYLKADIYAVITTYNENGDYVLKLNLIPLNDKYKDLSCERIITSRIPDNLPLKTAREFALMLRRMPLRSNIVKVLSDGTAVINSGQWHGLETGEYRTDAGSIKILNVSRYTAVAGGKIFTEGETVNFKLLPALDNLIKEINYQIGENTVRVFGTDEILDKRQGSVRESIKGTCIINQGANFCLPAYGSFLSVESMGIEKGKPDYSGVFIATSLTAVHLGLVPVLTDFKVNFLPWIEDSGRTGRMRRLNYFMWGSLPLTFTASFYNQLAYNYNEKNLLPPRFADHDTSAAVVSLFLPGGGMFYKGYRWAGWGIYLGEMALAGYAVYAEDKGERNLYLGSLAVVKCAEIAVSYLIPPAYNYFNREVSSSVDAEFNIGLNKNIIGEREVTASADLHF